MMTTLIVLHVIICLLLVVTVLLQFGKGAEMGAVMGGGASQAVFSSSSKGNFFTKLTSVLAIGFMVNSIVLTTMKSRDSKKSLFDDEAPVAAPLNSDAEKAAVPAATQGATAPGVAVPATGDVPAPRATAPAQVPGGAAPAPAQ